MRTVLLLFFYFGRLNENLLWERLRDLCYLPCEITLFELERENSSNMDNMRRFRDAIAAFETTGMADFIDSFVVSVENRGMEYPFEIDHERQILGQSPHQVAFSRIDVG